MSLTLRRGLTILIGVVVAVVMLLMGLWQMARFQASIVDVAAERAAEPPVVLAQSIATDGTIDDIYGRRVQFSGEVVPGYELLVGSQWPMRVVVPFAMTDGRIVPVVLGLGDRELSVTDAGPQSIEGIFTASDQEGELTPPSDAPGGSTATLRLQTLVQTWPQPLVAGYVTLNGDGAAQYGLQPARATLPEVQGSGMHQGYALQWWVFAAAAVAFSIVVARGLKPKAD
ncbi:MAG: SURF1 family protein [Arachnia sp.]